MLSEPMTVNFALPCSCVSLKTDPEAFLGVLRPEKYRELRQTEHTGRVELSARPFKDVSDEDLETMLEAAKAFKALKESNEQPG